MSKDNKKTKKQDQKQDSPKYITDNSSVEITIKWEEVQPIYQKTLKKLAKNLKLKGFRKGKVPLKIAEEKIDPNKLYNAVLQQVLPKHYQEAIEANKAKPLTEPEFQPISLNKDNDWIIKAYYAEEPEIKLKGYKKVVKKALKKAEKHIKETEKQAKEEAKKDKEKNKKKKKDGEKQAPTELTDAQKKDIKVQALFRELIKELAPQVPELLLRQNTRREIQKLQQQLKQLNIQLEDYLKSRGMNEQQLTSQMAMTSLNQLQGEFLLNAIAQKENIEVKDKEIDKRIAEVEDEKVKDRLKKDNYYQEYLKSVMLKQKTIEWLLEQ